MGKIKTHKASAKRFTLTGNGKIKMNHSQHRHNLGLKTCLLYTSPSPRDSEASRMPSSA